MLNPFFKNSFRFLPFVFCLLFIAPTCFAQERESLQQLRNVKRFVYQTSASLAYGVGENFGERDAVVPNSNFSIEIQQLVAYQFNHYVYAGVGAGADLWLTNDYKMSVFIPIFANATVKFMEKKMAPFGYANIGYGFKWQMGKKVDDYLFYGTKAGLYFQVGAGFNIKFSDRFVLLLSPYYKLQMSTISYRESELILATTPTQLFHFVGIRIGFLY